MKMTNEVKELLQEIAHELGVPVPTVNLVPHLSGIPRLVGTPATYSYTTKTLEIDLAQFNEFPVEKKRRILAHELMHAKQNLPHGITRVRLTGIAPVDNFIKTTLSCAVSFSDDCWVETRLPPKYQRQDLRYMKAELFCNNDRYIFPAAVLDRINYLVNLPAFAFLATTKKTTNNDKNLWSEAVEKYPELKHVLNLLLDWYGFSVVHLLDLETRQNYADWFVGLIADFFPITELRCTSCQTPCFDVSSLTRC